MIRQRAQYIHYFFYSRHVSDALLLTAGILIPAVVLARYGLFEAGVVVSLGALCVGVTDAAGPIRDKVKGMLLCNALNFGVAIITGLAGVSVILESIEVVTFCFVFAMFTLYGNRLASIGTTALMVMIMMMYRHTEDFGILRYAALLLAGGLWYALLSFIFYVLMPFRQTQQVVGECIMETSKSLRIKASLYNLNTDANKGLNDLILEQIKVNEKQEDVRQILFNNPPLGREDADTRKILTASFVELMDIYEQIMTTSYYEVIRVKFNRSGVMPVIEKLLIKMSENLNRVGRSVQSNRPVTGWQDTEGDFILFKKRVDDIASTYSESTFILKKALVTFRTMDQRIKAMAKIGSDSTDVVDHSGSFKFSMFVTPQQTGTGIFRENLNLRSSTFRFAIRVSLVAFIGFVVASFLSGGGHSYWILFTVVFILKPAFSLSKQRNYQRMGGTLAGALISFPVMLFVHNSTSLFMLLMLFMMIAYTFMRINYMVFVVFMTCYVILMFKLLGTGGLDIISERVLDTLIGATITFIAIYFIFPNWEFRQIRLYIVDMVSANRNFLAVIEDYFNGRDISMNDYKVARKRAYDCFANLAGSYQRMNSEPKSKQKNLVEIERFIILNYQLASMISTNASSIFTGKLEALRTIAGNPVYVHKAMETLDEILVAGTDHAIRQTSPERQAETGDVRSQFKSILDRSIEIRAVAAPILAARTA